MNREESIAAILAASNDEGTIQASDMLALSKAGAVPNDPRLHTTTNVVYALRSIGLTDREINAALDD